MKGNAIEIMNYLDKWKEGQIYIIDKIESKTGRTRQQEKTWYKLFNAISTHLWYNVEEVKSFLLAGTFGTHTMKLNTEEIEVPNESRTSTLTKEQWIFFIDTILKFVKLKDIPVEITPLEVQSLYDSYKSL